MEKSSLLLGVICSFLASFGQFLLKISVKELDFSFSINYYIFNKNFYLLIIAVFLYFLGFLLWLFLLKKIKLSEAVAFMVLSLVLTFIYSILLLKEPLTIKRVLGIILSVIGIFLILH